MVEPSARFEEVKIPLRAPVHGLESVSGVLGIPEWWPTGTRTGVVLGHGSARSASQPLLAGLQDGLTNKGYLTLRFVFPFAEANKRRPDKPDVLESTFRDAIGFLGRDVSSAPARLFVGGLGLGAKIAAQVALARLRVDGLIFVGYPLHAANKPEDVDAEFLYRLISPTLFIQGTRDRYCDLDALRRTLLRIGTPTTLHVVAEADHALKVLKKSGRTDQDVLEEVLPVVESWIVKLIDE